MNPLVSYWYEDGVATLTMDDGKVNVMSVAMIRALNEALNRAASDRAVVVLAGRDGVFSAGFDLETLGAGGPDAPAKVRGGFDLAARVLAFAFPVVVACTGHAIAMGAFLLNSGDYRIGAAGRYKLTANEVAIGLTLPRGAVAILRGRLTPSTCYRAVALAEVLTPENAVESGFLDRVVAPDRVCDEARSVAQSLLRLNMDAHAASKVGARQSKLDAADAQADVAGVLMAGDRA